ncbi:DEAD/DEAH box helicase [Chengkuizengella marina]|uniref:DEAD/DEAH box helicase n=1 Tax=Chengkuizengella marina TaxID=2507566 RepID=A0A6N9Q052_9BACL|nr:DEAD/DEAH box helicase [Chengkuizengella marina]NBI28637.1 DEAD/DEAH box helicase [Chengkuizengella marina]
MYSIKNIEIPQNKRKEINEKILYLIDNKIDSTITKTDMFNCYTGLGALHGLDYNSYDNYHSFKQDKQKEELGQFYTPFKLSKFITEMIQPSEYDMIADLTGGHGSLINFLPNQQNVYVNEYEIKSYKVLKHLFSDTHYSNEDIRNYKPDVMFDTILGNPPYNIKFEMKHETIMSQLYYMIKSYELLKPAGLLVLIVPDSFLSDDFTDSGMIDQVNERFNHIKTFELPNNTFKNVGVDNFSTKIMIFQKKSQHITDVPYSPMTDNNIILTHFTKDIADQLHNKIVKPVLQLKNEVKNKLILEQNHYTDEEKIFNDQVKKLLFDIRQSKNTRQYYVKSENYVMKYKTQKQPEGMEWEEWYKKRITKNKVISYLKRILKNQHKKEEHKTRLVKTNYGLKYKAYSRKEKYLLNKIKGKKEISFNDMIIDNNYPFQDNRYRKLFNQKRKQYEQQSEALNELEHNSKVMKWLNDLTIYDRDNDESIKLNEIQKQDTANILNKNYGYLQWGTGSGKSISAIAQMLYRKQHNNIKNIYLVAPAIAINNNWDEILKSYNIDFIRIKKLKDINNIKHGQIVIMTFGMLTKYQHFIKKSIKQQSQKVMMVLDEADGICNPSSKRTKATLNCFRRVKYKLLMSATSTRNNIPESFTSFELLYNNSINMLCEAQEIFVENKRTKEIDIKHNEKHYMKPFPTYKKGHTLFKRCFAPEKATVFGVGKQTQDIYNSNHLKTLIDKTMITRTFEEVSGKQLYNIIQNTCTFNTNENALYKVIIEEFYKLAHMFKSTGNSRKDSLLKIINQLNSLLKACVIPNTFKEYHSLEKPSKAVKTTNMLNIWNNEIVVIGCTHIKTVNTYWNHIRNSFPDRELFIITGESTTLNKRKEIIKHLKKSKNGILICTQQSLSSSMNIDFVNKVLIVELMYNFAAHHQFFARFVRYTSTKQKEIHFLTQRNSIESNLLQLIMSKEKLNSFMKNDYIDDDEIHDRFGIDFDILDMLMSREVDSEGKSYIRWGSQQVV